jgi:acid stress chaperone HdeA
MKRFTTMLMTGLAAAALASACSSTVVNQGGDTTCKDFNTAEEQKQNDAVSKMLKDEKGADPTNLEITGTRLAVSTYCQTLGTEETKISEAPHA